ncbi:Mitotic apparatus protein [Histomonas meleagridis]|uniref:Mitotic apparatus protein n=1 Tax=Histomonas meleagridis TaxID=135588 RepID=UPI0035597AE4|nr:Mitotic apparatus protein [Histomonas meleagridis]KAH0796882.1 Mitotic apparatus protein [Histomonas meleagridis]
MSDTPAFEYPPEDQQFEVGQKIYVIDPNEFDIYEAQISAIDGNKYQIHYPDYPDDDGEIEGTKRFLIKTEKNNKIFEEQDRIRLQEEARALEEEEEEAESQEDEDDKNYEQKDNEDDAQSKN